MFLEGQIASPKVAVIPREKSAVGSSLVLFCQSCLEVCLTCRFCLWRFQMVVFGGN